MLLLAGMAWAEKPSQQSLQKAYARAAFGAELRFLDGLLANRSDDFKLYGANGSLQDLHLERLAFAQMLQASGRVKLETLLLDYHPVADGATATVEQVLKFEQVDEASNRLCTRVFRTRSRDHWRVRAGKLQLIESRVLHQTASLEAPLAEP